MPTTGWSRWCATSCCASRSRTSGPTSRTGTACDPTPTRTRTSSRSPTSSGTSSPRRARRVGSASGSRVSRRRRGARGVQTVALVLDHLSDLCGDGCCVLTLPKVTSVAQVEALVAVLERLEKGLSWTPREPAVRDPGGDAPDHPRAGRLRAGGQDDPGRRASPPRPALRHLRLLGLPRHRGRGPEPRAPRGRPRQGGDAGGRGRHRRRALGRVHQPAAGRRPAAAPAGRRTTGW